VKGRRERPRDDAPRRPFGYSNAGVIVERGEGCDDLEIGTRVACMGGGYAHHASHACVPRNLCVPLPREVGFAEGASNHLAATAMHAVRRGEVTIGEHFVVVGLGVVGQFACQLARLSGAHVMGMDRLPLRLRVAAACEVDAVVNPEGEDPLPVAEEFTRGYGMDGGIMAFGGDGTTAFRQIVAMLKKAPDGHKMGRVVNVGGARIEHGFAAALGNVDIRSSARPGPGYHDVAWEHGKEYPPVFVPWTTRRNIETCLRFIAEGRLRVEPLITHRVPLDEAPAACETLIQSPGEALGVILEP
jgi:threonine dehydrogenase-like Zn-dependent dehydrogenase